MQSDQGLNEWFARTVEEGRLSMYRVARGMVRTDADAEDAVSAATLSAYEHLDRLRNREALPGYLMRCVINACRGMMRRQKREIATEELEEVAPAALAETPAWMYVHQLPEKYRLPILLRYAENMPLREVSRILRLPKGTVASRCSRGLEILRKQMIKEGSGDE